MPTDRKAVIVVFQDPLSKAEVEIYADQVVQNGGTITERYYEKPGGINGFSALIDSLEAFKSFKAGDINYIEGDKEFTT